MKYTTHSIYGILIFLIILKFYPLTFLEKIFVLALAILGSLLPDIDSHKSKIGKYFFFLNFGCKHRGWLHSIGGLILTTAISILITTMLKIKIIYAIALNTGIFSHIVLDSLNKKGIQPFYPLKKPRLKGPIKMGSLGEWVVAGVGVFALILI